MSPQELTVLKNLLTDYEWMCDIFCMKLNRPAREAAVELIRQEEEKEDEQGKS